MTNLAASILETFPYDTINQTHLIGSVPTFATIEASVQQLNANAASIRSLQGNGKPGHIVLTIGATAYTAQAPNKIAFVVAPNPGASQRSQQEQLPPTLVSSEKSTTRQDRLLYETYMQTDDALKKLLIVATDKDYLKTLNHPIYGFSEHTTSDLINYLYDTYGTITNKQLRDNETKMNADWHFTTTIEKLLNNLDEGAAYAHQEGIIYSNEHMILKAYTKIIRSPHMEHVCRDWRKIPRTSRTWKKFCSDFTIAYTNAAAQATTRAAGYQANLAEELREEIGFPNTLPCTKKPPQRKEPKPHNN